MTKVHVRDVLVGAGLASLIAIQPTVASAQEQDRADIIIVTGTKTTGGDFGRASDEGVLIMTAVNGEILATSQVGAARHV